MPAYGHGYCIPIRRPLTDQNERAWVFPVDTDSNQTFSPVKMSRRGGVWCPDWERQHNCRWALLALWDEKPHRVDKYSVLEADLLQCRSKPQQRRFQAVTLQHCVSLFARRKR